MGVPEKRHLAGRETLIARDVNNCPCGVVCERNAEVEDGDTFRCWKSIIPVSQIDIDHVSRLEPILERMFESRNLFSF